MSGLAYFPPNTGRWLWKPRGLQTSPWSCHLSQQLKPEGLQSVHPLNVMLTINRDDTGQFVWRVRITDWTYKRHDEMGTTLTAEEAVTCAENVGEAAFKAFTPPWVLMALENGWRPPWPSTSMTTTDK